MFKLNESISTIDVPADRVVHLFRSMRDVQLALPGNQSQLASAYICQYKKDAGVCTVAVFHLHKSNLLAFYLGDPPVVPVGKTDSMLDQGLNFIESMGFLMTDQDIHLLDDADRDMLWSSLPLRAGLQPEEASAPAAVSKKTEPVDAAEMPAATYSGPAAMPVEAPPAAEVKPEEPPPAEASAQVDDLLAAVEAMRAKRPGLRARRTPPPLEEVNRRRQQLRESVGRILASL